MAEFREYKIYHYEKGASEGIEVDFITDVRITLVSQAKSNSAEITLSNYASNLTPNGELKYNVDDIFKIYATKGLVDINDANALIGTFFIKNIAFQPENKTITLTCGDHTYDLLNRSFPMDYNGETSPNIIYNIIQTIPNDGTEQYSVTTDMASTKSDGSAFPTFDYANVNKTAYEVILNLSQPEYTGDKQEYLFWFDQNNIFHWVYPNTTIESNKLSYGSEPIIKMKGGRTETDTISSVIYNAGNDLVDVSITDLYHNDNATSTNIKYTPMIDIAKKYKRKFSDGNGGYTITNDTFIAICKIDAVARSKSIIRNVGTGLWKADIEVKGDHYTIGKLYTVEDNINNFESQILRIKRIVHTLNKNGWTTKLSLEQDPEEEQ